MGRVDTSSPADIRENLDRLAAYEGSRLTFMEVCGTHTMAVARSGLGAMLPQTMRLISGPGCPVCVTPVDYVDHALALARIEDTIITTFGDLVRVPGSARHREDATPPSLARIRGEGGDVRVVYSPLDALGIARSNPDKEVVFLGVGFETTAPVLASAILRARQEGLGNFSMLSAAKTIPRALDTLADSDEVRLDGLLCPGHVSVILGYAAYEELVAKHGLPCAVAGFEPIEILRGLVALVDQVREGASRVDNCYPGAVSAQGNSKARDIMYRVFEPVTGVWRGLGSIEGSGLGIRAELGRFDAAKRFEVALLPAQEPKGCRCGDVLRGVLDPVECGLFGRVCTPLNPQGACMVSSEGSCAARFQYGKGGAP